MHPSVQSLLLTAISPRSLSFRTVLLPSDVNVRLSLSPRSRSAGIQLSLDGHEVRTLLPSQSLSVSMSPFPVPWIIGKPTAQMTAEVEGKDEGAGRVGRTGWVGDIRRSECCSQSPVSSVNES